MDFFKQIKFIRHYSGYSKNKQKLLLIYFLFSAFIQVMTSYSIMYLIDITIDNVEKRYIVSGLFIILVIFNAILLRFLRKKFINIAFESEKNIFKDITQNLFIEQINSINSTSKGKIHAMLMGRVKEYRFFLMQHLENIFYRPFLFFISIITILILDYKISIIVIFCIILTSILNIYFSEKIISSSKKHYDFQGDFYQYQKELIDQYDVTILTGMKKTALKRYLEKSQMVQTAEKNVIKRHNSAYIPALLNEYLPTLLYMFIIIVNINNFNLSYGKALTLMTIIGTISLPLSHTLRSFIVLRKNIPFMEEVENLLCHTDKSTIKIVDELGNDCLFKINKLKFLYDNNVSLFVPNIEIYRGDKIAILGETGSGKTTFFKILLGLVNFQSGEMSIASYSKFTDLKGFWKNISYLDNNTHIFDGSLRYNITFNENEECDVERYYEIINKLDLLKFDNQYIYQDGRNLSGGQKMRICLARALYNNSEIFLLDEPMASLDKESEKDIINILNDLQKTIIVITHRKDVLRICNRIFYVKDGVINE